MKKEIDLHAILLGLDLSNMPVIMAAGPDFYRGDMENFEVLLVDDVGKEDEITLYEPNGEENSIQIPKGTKAYFKDGWLITDSGVQLQFLEVTVATEKIAGLVSGLTDCQVCGSSNLDGDMVIIDYKHAVQNCSCNECNSVQEMRYLIEEVIITQAGNRMPLGDGDWLEIGDTVVVDDPKDGDIWNHSFAGQVTGFRATEAGILVVVVDGDDCHYDVCLDQLNKEDI